MMKRIMGIFWHMISMMIGVAISVIIWALQIIQGLIGVVAGFLWILVSIINSDVAACDEEGLNKFVDLCGYTIKETDE